MKAYLLLTASSPLVILTSHNSINNPEVLDELCSKGIVKFVAHELSLKLVKARYGTHFDIICKDPDQSDSLRVLEESGERAFSQFSFEELGPPIYHESK